MNDILRCVEDERDGVARKNSAWLVVPNNSSNVLNISVFVSNSVQIIDFGAINHMIFYSKLIFNNS